MDNYHKEYYEKNKTKILEKQKLKYQQNKEYYVNYRENNKEKISENQKNWYEKNKEYQKKHYNLPENKLKKRNQYLLRNYGIDLEGIKQLLNEQNNNCAICFKKIEGSEIHVDHCHKTKKIRGLLCILCNTALGKFLDNTDILKNAIKYLEKQNVTNKKQDNIGTS